MTLRVTTTVVRTGTVHARARRHLAEGVERGREPARGLMVIDTRPRRPASVSRYRGARAAADVAPAPACRSAASSR